MFKLKLIRLMDEFGIKQEALIQTMGSNRVTFGKKMEDNSFTDEDKKAILDKYGSLLD